MIGPCGYDHSDDDDRCLHGQVVLDGFLFGDMVPGHKQQDGHVAAKCGWCLLYGNTQPLTRDTRRCHACSIGDHGLCESPARCGCACALSPA